MSRGLDQHLKLQLLRVIDALAEHGSLLKASVALGLSQPALTKSLKDLEALVGVRLFERGSRGVIPTQAGLALIRSSRRILAELKRVDEDLDFLNNPFGGTAAVGALPVAASGLAAIVLIKVRSDFPGFKMRLEQGRTEQLLPLLAAGHLDLVVGRFYESAGSDFFRREQLWEDPFAIVARTDHPIFRDGSVTESGGLRGNQNSLSRFELVLPVAPQRITAEVEALLEPLGLKRASVIWSATHTFTRETLILTDAITIVPPMAMLGDINRGLLKAIPLPFAAPRRPAGIITVEGRELGGAAKAFIKVLRDQVAEVIDNSFAEIMRQDVGATAGLYR